MIFLLHVTWSCIVHAYVPFHFLYWYSLWLVLFCLFLSLPLSRTICAWHLSVNPLRPGTFFISGHHLLILLFLSGSMMIKPIKTFRRTSPNVAFIRNATLSYQTFLILFFQMSYTGEVENPFVGYPWVVHPWSYMSFTPICTDLITLYLISPLIFEVFVYWLLRILYLRYYMFWRWSFLTTLDVYVWGLCPNTSFCLSSVRHLHHGVTLKTPHARALQKVRGSWIWWWHLFYIPYLTIILLLSLVLTFCCPSLRTLPLTFPLTSYSPL